jgi:hypothetical protein
MVDWHSLLRADAGVAEDGVFTFAGAQGVPRPTVLAKAVAALARDRALAANGARGWWEREDRFLALDELLTRAANGVPEGDHVVRARTGAT